VTTGAAANICVHFTAADAQRRAYELWVRTHALASEADERTGCALEIMRNSMQAKTGSTQDITHLRIG
jgi:nicotinamidase-related amidase